MTLKASELALVDDGKMFIAQVMAADGLSGRSTAVQSIAAPPKTIWAQLLDFNAYPPKVDKLVDCKVYADNALGMGNRQLKVMMKINAAPGFNYEYYCDHTYSPKDKSLIWTLDYERDSDFDDVTGHWYVTPHPTRENWSQVYYSADLKLKQWVPKFILNILTTTAIKVGAGCAGPPARVSQCGAWRAANIVHANHVAPHRIPPPLPSERGDVGEARVGGRLEAESNHRRGGGWTGLPNGASVHRLQETASATTGRDRVTAEDEAADEEGGSDRRERGGFRCGGGGSGHQDRGGRMRPCRLRARET